MQVSKLAVHLSFGERATGWNFRIRWSFSGLDMSQSATVYMNDSQLFVDGCIETAKISNSRSFGLVIFIKCCCCIRMIYMVKNQVRHFMGFSIVAIHQDFSNWANRLNT